MNGFAKGLTGCLKGSFKGLWYRFSKAADSARFRALRSLGVKVYGLGLPPLLTTATTAAAAAATATATATSAGLGLQAPGRSFF